MRIRIHPWLQSDGAFASFAGMTLADSVNAPVDFVIVTALEEERAALLAKLPDCQPLPPEPQDIRR